MNIFPKNIYLQIWWSTPSPKRTGNVWQECSLFIFIFLMTAALNVLKPYNFQVEKCKKLPKEKKTWVGIVGEMQNTWMKYSALEFAAHLCASIISFWVWSMWFTQVLRMDNSQTKQFRKFFDSMSWARQLLLTRSSFSLALQETKAFVAMLASTQTTFQLCYFVET